MVALREELVDRACAQTGLADFGPHGWQEGLDHLLSAITMDIGDDRETASAIEAIVVNRLVHRLRIEQWYAEHANAAAQPVGGPVVIVGLPRTATTALQHILALDPRFRYPRVWEMSDPVPPPRLHTENEDPRRRKARAKPHDVRHISTVDGPTEDGAALSFHFHHQEMALPLPTYTTWWRDADLTGTFAYYDRVLRLLHAYRPPYHWLVKAPAYLFHLTAIARQYPNARFLMTHRDPAAALPSTCSTVLTARGNIVPTARADASTTGRYLLEHFAEGTRRAIAARRTLGDERFCDVAQQEFEDDPLGTVTRVYDFLGLELKPDVRSAMRSWAAKNRRGARGRHTYSAEQYGLTPSQIRDAFADYLDTFPQHLRQHAPKGTV